MKTTPTDDSTPDRGLRTRVIIIFIDDLETSNARTATADPKGVGMRTYEKDASRRTVPVWEVREDLNSLRLK